MIIPTLNLKVFSTNLKKYSVETEKIINIIFTK